MALSLLSHQQQPNYFDLQTLFDPYPLQQQHQQSPSHLQQQQQYHHQQHIQQQQQQQQDLTALKSTSISAVASKINPTTGITNFCADQMEYAASNLHQNHNHYQQQQNNNSSDNNNNSGVSSISNNSRKISGIAPTNNNSQILHKTNRFYTNGYSHHQIASDYVITFVDSPPNSEESWTDEQSKETPGPQIIDVQTIYSNSGSRKRRMDWDPLDIGQSGTTTAAQSGELANKIPLQEKEKQKKEKTAGRGSWTEDIGFDLNTDFNSNSYLSNESFLSFSPALTVLKQEPQSDQLKVSNKSPLNTHPAVGGSGGSVPKLDKAASHVDTAATTEDTSKNALNNSLCGCGSPKSGVPQEIEHNGNNADKSNSSGANGFGNTGSPYGGGEKITVQGNSGSQQLTVVDGSKVENSTGGGGVNGNNANAHSDDHKFQYILAAATSIATKNNEETLTYLNQGQSYEIKLKKIGDLSFYRDKILKVFKLKGADRKHKQDREKIQRRPQAEQEKFQPSYECTIMNDIPLELITSTTSGSFSPEYLKIWPNSPVHIPKYDGILPYTGGSPVTNTNPIAINSVTSTNSPTLKLMDGNMVSPQQSTTPDMDDYAINILPESTPSQVAQWLNHHRLTSYLSTFAHFSGSDIMRMSKEDLIQICGLADGIRMFNILRAKAIAPRLTLYVSMDGSSYNAIYLVSNTSRELMQKLCKMPGFYEMIANGTTNGTMENGTIYSNWSMHSKYSGSGSNIFSDSSKNFIFLAGPSGVHVNVTDEVLNNEVKDGSLYTLEVQNGQVVMKLINKNDN
ncbi:uncharacterized protein DDB_G0283357 isoform X2 [Rhagoletis pomonella]|uniref:uncharacterized protein DDB_G0283357 isoform X2 n=1 Tax=Rhagoletis pomonella TaxID=28610 RepID=UPI00177CA45D|nr:uncharacterized protein DDB_G0283357 isoform X2 [Rhagoletis pomonella]